MTTIWKVPLVPFVAGITLVAFGTVGAIVVDPSAVIFTLFGIAGLGYQRDVTIHGRRVDDCTDSGGEVEA